MEQGKPNRNGKGKAQVGITPARLNTNDLFGVGSGRSSDESSVMEVERRAGVKRLRRGKASSQRRSKTIPIEVREIPITYKMVMDAYVVVKRNKGSAGVDRVSLGDFADRLHENLYCLWNRLSSGNYHSHAVRQVGIPKKDGKIRYLGIPTVADRIAQQVIKSYLDPRFEELFSPTSYGYRSQKNAHQALREVRKNCWKYKYVIDMDIKSFFDEVSHELLLKAVRKHVAEKWVVDLIIHWLRAPIKTQEGELIVKQGMGTPQGGVISPLLANLFMHYVLDAWLVKKHPSVKHVRYADDVIVHCRNAVEAEAILKAIDERMTDCKLRLHPDKTKIVCCQVKGKGSTKYPIVFDFLGYRFQPRTAKSRKGELFLAYDCAISPGSEKRITEELRNSQFQKWTSSSIEDIANTFGPKLRGWLNYYGELGKYRVRRIFDRFNFRLLRWVKKKYGGLKDSYRKAAKWLRTLAKENPGLFPHWSKGYIYS
jgi:group II intron reverse transcriptase/maturase